MLVVQIETLILGISSSLIATVFFLWLQKKLKLLYPNEIQIMELIKTDKGNIAYQKVEVLTHFMFAFLIWLFLGNLFWLSSEFLQDFARLALEVGGELGIAQILKNEVNLPIWIRFSFKLLGILCFYAGIKILLRVYKIKELHSVAIAK